MAMNEDVDKGDLAINLFLLREFDTGMDTIEAFIEGFCWICESIIGAETWAQVLL